MKRMNLNNKTMLLYKILDVSMTEFLMFVQGEVCGLCGNFDGNGENDFTTQSGLVVSNPLEFANSWKGKSSCSDVEKLVDACKKAPHRDNWAKTKCKIITGDKFKDCHSKVEEKLFVQ